MNKHIKVLFLITILMNLCFSCNYVSDLVDPNNNSTTTNTPVTIQYAYIVQSTKVTVCSINSGSFSNCQSTGNYTYTNATDIAINNNVAYIVDYTLNQIISCSISNNIFSNCGNSGATGLNNPSGILIIGNYAFITNSGGGAGTTVSSCSVNGQILSGCTTTAGFNGPVGIHISGDQAYIANNNTNNVRVCVFDGLNFSSCSNTGSSLNNPLGMIVYNGFAYISNQSTSAITICTVTSGSPVNSLTGCAFFGLGAFGGTSAFAINLNYFYYVSNTATVNVCTILSNGNLSNCTNSGATGYSSPGSIRIY